ncbi:putative quinol monooxygenase [Streptomyces olivoverticillatus]|uniref:putative quinol monooxygenase n=1 Tax=Streptomyces olivoverticillatus TaxID=66427 RepID=UPI0031B6151E
MRFILRDAAATAAFDELVSQTLDGIRKHEPGTLLYVSHGVPGEPEQRVFYEMYRDRAAFEVHERQPHIRHFLVEREKFVTAADVTFLERIEGQ